MIPATVDERSIAYTAPADFAYKCADSKAKSIAAVVSPDSLVIAADTVVALGDEVFGKPKNSADAVRMLQALAGKMHRVYTGLVVIQRDQYERQIVETRVFFATLTDEQIERYVSTGEPLDKAGAYGIQGRGALCVDSIEGCYYNVVGLPLRTLAQMLRRFGVELP